MSGGVPASVVITAHNEASSIEACIGSIEAQRDLTGAKPDIVLVDDRSSDGTGARACALAPAVRLVRVDRYERPHLTARQVALDQGIRAARGDVVLLTEADAVASPDWVRSRLALVENTGADVVAGPVSFRPDGSAVLAALQSIDAVGFLAWCGALNALGLAAGLLFGNVAFRKDAYTRLGGFDAMGRALSEDLAFARAAHRAGQRIVFDAVPRVSVLGVRSWRQLISRRHRASRGGVSALSLSLGLWALALVVPAACALSGSGEAVWWFGARYLIGVAAVEGVLWKSRQLRLWPYAFVYELAAVAASLCVAASRVVRRHVEWGGVRYES